MTDDYERVKLKVENWKEKVYISQTLNLIWGQWAYRFFIKGESAMTRQHW